MALTTFPYGAPVRMFVLFKDEDGVPRDPNTVKFYLRKPNPLQPEGVEYIEHTYGMGGDVAKEETGLYSVSKTGDEPGDWHFAFEGIGTVDAVKEGMFAVSYPRARQVA